MLTRRTLVAGLPAVALAPALITRRALAAANKTVSINGVLVTDLGQPRCVIKNGAPRVPRGGYHANLFDDNPHLGTTSPWGSFSPLNGYYSALIGSVSTPPGPAVALYEFRTPRKVLEMIWGTPDEGNHLQFFMGDTPVGVLFGNEISGAFGWNDGINLQLQTADPFNTVKLASYVVAFEFANFDAAC